MDWLDVRDAGAAAPPEDGGADVLAGLNDAQRDAVTHDAGPLLIVAGPGSGKTRVITHRIAHLVTERGAAPHEILAITFTNKAAREMRERVEALLPGTSGLWVATFHATCARILRRDIEVLGRHTRDFTILDTADRNALLKQILKDLDYDPKRFRPAVVGGWISRRKNVRAEGRAHAGGAGMDEDVFEKVEAAYARRLPELNALDFDDLLLEVVELFDAHPGVRDAYARRFRHVLVDEYQDTNRVQYLLVRHFASFHGELTVCGDPDQSIYGWRGADIGNILDFEKDFPDATTVRLERNYRSTQRILDAANALIRNNTGRKPKELYTEGPEGERVVVIECGDENDEAREIVAQLRGHVGRGGSWGDCAVLYRANFMQRAIEAALRVEAVPYQVVAGLEFYQRREIKDLVAYLRLAVNPADDVAFARVVNTPSRGVGATSLARLVDFASQRGVPLSAAVREPAALDAIRGRAKKGLAEFAGLLDRLADARELDAAVAMDLVLEELDVPRWMQELDDGTNVVDREANVDELRAYAEEFDRLHPDAGLRGFLQDVALVSETDELDDDSERVKLMTLHACKGLEFPVVAVAGVEEDLLPHARALEEAVDDVAAVEEERRLLYVGLTRARERVLLTHAGYRSFFGGGRPAVPSRFLAEIPPELVEGLGEEAREEDVLGVYESQGDGADALAVGDRVHHDHFGRGRIVQLVGSGVNARATVDFASAGTKQLLLQYAHLERVDA